MTYYEVLFYNGWETVAAYYLIDSVEGNTPEQALAENIDQVTQKVRELFGLDSSDLSNERLRETIYILREGGLVPVQNGGSS